jgi:hypothetical protein
MKKNYLIFPIFSLFLIIISCNKEIDLQKSKNDSVIEENKEKGIMVDLYLHDFAKSLAKNINNKNLSTSLKNQIGKQFDGDYDVLLEDFYKKIQLLRGF